MSANPPLEFLDTNVLVYAYDPSTGPRHEQARSLVDRLWDSQTGCISLQVLTEFYVTITRKITLPLPGEAAAQIVSDLSTWHLHIPAMSDLLEAIRIQRRYQISLWDALIIHSASRLGCSVLWSEDLNAGQVYVDVKLASPFHE